MEIEVLEINWTIAIIYLAILGALTEALAQYLKSIVKYLILSARNENDEQYKVMFWKQLTLPILSGFFITWAFMPNTLFLYMPFVPRNMALEVLFTAAILSRAGNAAHGGYDKISDTLNGLIGRLMKRF